MTSNSELTELAATPREVYCYTPPRELPPLSPVADLPEPNPIENPQMLETTLHHPSPKYSSRPSPPKIHTSFSTSEQHAPNELKQDYQHSPIDDTSPSPAYFQSYATQFDLGYLDNGNLYPQWSDFELGLDPPNDLFFAHEISSTSTEWHQPQPPRTPSVPLHYQPLFNQATPPTSLSSIGTPSEASFSPTMLRTSQNESTGARKRKFAADALASPIDHKFGGFGDFIKHELTDLPIPLTCGLNSCQYRTRHKTDWLKHMENQHALTLVNSIGALKSVEAANRTSKRYRANENDALCDTFLNLSLTRGPNHIETIHSLENLVNLCKDQGDYLSAELLAKKAEEANIETLGSTSRATLGAACARIDALACQGQYTTAKIEAEVLLKRATNLFGPYDCVTVVTSSLLSKILYALGSYRSAETMAKQVFLAAVERLGVYHIETLTAKAFWAVVLLSVNRAAEGESVLRAVIRRYRPADKMLLLDRKGDLAYACAMQRKFEESEILEREVLAGQTALLGREHPNTLKTMVRLARTLRLQTRFEEAEEMLMEVLGMQTRVLGKESREFHVTWEEIGRCLRLVDGREQEALEWLEKAGSPLL